MATGYVWHERCFWHDTGRGAGSLPSGGWLQPGESAESEETKRRAHNLVVASELIDRVRQIRPELAPEEALLRVHSRAYVERIARLSAASGGDAGDGATTFGRGGYETARLAAGGAIAAVDAVLGGEVENAYVLVRPPGHHAEREHGIGYCIFGNVAIAAAHARAAHGLERVAVVDWDVHHGNGTQAIFYDDPRTLTISLHQDRSFPQDSGTLSERGRGDGIGRNINIPLSPGSGVGAYVYAFERIVLPALGAFEPQLILVACGFDASAADPLGRMMLHSDGYRRLTSMLMETARSVGAKFAMVHEGGYSAWYVPFCVLAVVETLSGIRTAVEDPYLSGYAASPGQELQLHQRDALDAVRAAALNPAALAAR